MVKVMGKVKVESHNMGPTFCRLTSVLFYVSRASHYRVTIFFQNLTLKIKGKSHGWGHSPKSQCGSTIWSTHIPFVPCQSALPFLRYSIFKIWPWKSSVKAMGEVTVQSQNMGLTSYPLTFLSLDVNRASHSSFTTFSKFDLEYQGLMLHNYRSRQFHRTVNGINPSSGFRYTCSATSGQSAVWFDKFLTDGQARMGQTG